MNTSPYGLLLQSISGSNGKISSTRTQSSFVTVVIMFVWAYLSIAKGDLMDIPEYLALMVLGGIGLTAYRSTKETNHEKKEPSNVSTIR